MDDVLFRIGEIAAFYNVSVKAMRIYEKAGVLTPVKIDEATGYRYYSADQVKRLDALIELRALGFTLAEIKGLLERGPDRDAYMEAMAHKKAMWQDRISVARDRIENIDGIIKRMSASDPPVKLHALTDDERAHLLSRLVNLDYIHGTNVLSEALWL
ncbi:MAG: MerR family transcriptional regulator [Oscillospiraceae bacterium]|nr:MerR family transcriptional regulator [Oscillospiraceae bacterium]